VVVLFPTSGVTKNADAQTGTRDFTTDTRAQHVGRGPQYGNNLLDGRVDVKITPQRYFFCALLLQQINRDRPRKLAR